MCVMDFAFDFQPLNTGRNKQGITSGGGDIDIKMNREDMMNNSNMVTKGGDKNPNNQSPVVKLSLENDEIKNNNLNLVSNVPQVNQMNQQPQQIQVKAGDEIGQLMIDTINTVNSLKIIKKKVEIETKITYTYEDGSTKVVTQNESHEFNN